MPPLPDDLPAKPPEVATACEGCYKTALELHPKLIRYDVVMSRHSCDDCWAKIDPSKRGYGSRGRGNRPA